MERIYLDSSVYVKLFKEEEGSDVAKKLISLAETSSKIKIFLSYWVINESIAAIDKTQNQKHIMGKKRKEIIIATILKKIIDYSESNIVVVPLNHRFVRDSVNYIYEYNISADDALHVYVAHKNNCRYFICRDKHLKQQTDHKIDKLRVLDITDKNEIDSLLNRITRL